MVIQKIGGYNPYSAQGASISRLVSVGYMTGKNKTNPENLMTDKALPDFSGIKLDTSGPVFSLPQTKPSENAAYENIAASEPLKMYTLTLDREVKFIEPTYNLHGAVFSYDEIQTSREYLEGLTQIMRENGAFSLTLDYDDYAVMGLGESQVRAFGKEQGFSSEQIEALATDYRNSIEALVAKHLEEFPFDRQVTHLPQSKYFFVHRAEDHWVGDHHVKEGTFVSSPELAVNWDMIQSIYDMMSKVDQNSSSSMKNAVAWFEQEALTARSAGMVVPSWSNWRVGIYTDNIEKFENAADSLRSEMKAKYPHLDTQA